MGPLALSAWMLLGGCLARAAQQSAAPAERDVQALYTQLDKVLVDTSQIYLIRDARITRGALNIYFDRGVIGFFAPVEGRITGATFQGEGEVLLIPPNPVEKRSLAQFTKSAVLEERFTSAFMRFTDETARQLLQKARPAGPEDAGATEGFAERWNASIGPFNGRYSIRILEDILGRKDLPYFQARVTGGPRGEFVVTDDERLTEAIQVTATRHLDDRTYTDVWCSFPSPSSKAHWDSLSVGPARVVSYKIDTKIAEDHSLEGRAVLELESRSNEDAILPIELSSQLRVLGVEDEEGHPLTVFPANAKQEPAAGERGDWLAVALASPRPAGSRFQLTFRYAGNVITDAGNDVLYVGSRGSWYPNRGEFARASFDLTFQYPERETLVATGRRVEETASGGWKHSRWVADVENLVAGFNLGVYKSRERKVGNVRIEVYASKEAEAALEKRYAERSPTILILPGTVAEGMKGARLINVPPPPPLDPAALLDEVLSKAADSVQYFNQIFGPFPYSHLALAQIPGDFGQGWPGLVYLPTFSFLQGAEREQLSGHALGHEMDLGPFVAHEIAHQWWGNEVGWNSYHDQWLSEGFASYAAALALARERDGDRKLHEVLQSYKRDLMAKKLDGETVESGGPIWLGQRLSSSQNLTGYNDIAYKKSCWVLHMLRTLLTDPKTGSDAQFFEALRNFVKTYSGKNPTTEDFLKLLEQYVTPTLDLEHNHRMDWFFADWVYGTGIPEYKLEHKIRRLAADQYVVEGEISQDGVPDEFEMLVPVIAEGGGAKNAMLGWVPVSNSGGKFRFTTRFKPSRVTINDEDLLAIVK